MPIRKTVDNYLKFAVLPNTLFLHYHIIGKHIKIVPDINCLSLYSSKTASEGYLIIMHPTAPHCASKNVPLPLNKFTVS